MAKINRRLAWKQSLESARSLILVQGEVVHAANLLHDEFYHLFSIALSLERPDEFGAEIRFHDHALAIWHCSQADSQQRKMAINAISTVPTELKLTRAVTRLKWAIKQVEILAEYRNLLAHNPVMFSAGRSLKVKGIKWNPVFGGRSIRPLHRRRLAEIKNLRFWHSLRNDFINLSEYVRAVNVQIQRMEIESRGATLVGAPKSWPDRPRLRSLFRIQEVSRISPPATQKTKRHIRRRPLPG